MPKMKTNRAAAKRIKRTGSGAFKRFKAYGKHILTKKSSKRKRAYRQSLNCEKSNENAMKVMLPYA
jgi:large subunit ribosomal protein L35